MQQTPFIEKSYEIGRNPEILRLGKKLKLAYDLKS